MSIRVFAAVLVATILSGSMPARAEILPTPPGWQIERAVLVNRHGVRSPTAPNEQLDRHSATPWPSWPVEPGFLSPRGEELMRLTRDMVTSPSRRLIRRLSVHSRAESRA